MIAAAPAEPLLLQQANHKRPPICGDLHPGDGQERVSGEWWLPACDFYGQW